MSEDQIIRARSRLDIPREAEARLSSLNLNPEILKDKKVLDLGSGRSEVGEYLNNQGIDCVSLDYSQELILWGTENRVRAYAEALPFKDSTFDSVISFMGPPMLAGIYSYNVEEASDWEWERFYREMEKQAAEIKRVLKPGGEFRINEVDLQFLANQAHCVTRDESDEAADREFGKAREEAWRLYQEKFPGIQQIKEKNKFYLLWQKPEEEKKR